jgi:hypothetical protein
LEYLFNPLPFDSCVAIALMAELTGLSLTHGASTRAPARPRLKAATTVVALGDNTLGMRCFSTALLRLSRAFYSLTQTVRYVSRSLLLAISLDWLACTSAPELIATQKDLT